MSIDQSSPGFRPGDVDHDNLDKWHESYAQLSNKDKILLETQEQTRLIKSILSIARFFLWISILSILATIGIWFLGSST